jgi:hypothetical protein
MWIVWKVLGFLTQLLIVEHSLHTLTLIQLRTVEYCVLKFLDLGENLLMSFPPVIDKMQKLDYFNITGNNINHNMKLKRDNNFGPAHFQKSKNFRKQKTSIKSLFSNISNWLNIPNKSSSALEVAMLCFDEMSIMLLVLPFPVTKWF